MSIRCRLRVQLPDRRGALANLTGVIAKFGGDVVAVDIHEVEGADAVDEISVVMPDDWDPDQLAAGINAMEGARLVSWSPQEPHRDAVVQALRWTRLLIEAGVHRCDLELSRSICEICTSSVTWIYLVEEASTVEIAQAALDLGGPVVRMGQPPTSVDSLGAGPAWILAVPDAPQGARRVAVVARPASLSFTVTEVDRVQALLSVSHSLNESGSRHNEHVRLSLPAPDA